MTCPVRFGDPWADRACWEPSTQGLVEALEQLLVEAESEQSSDRGTSSGRDLQPGRGDLRAVQGEPGEWASVTQVQAEGVRCGVQPLASGLRVELSGPLAGAGAGQAGAVASVGTEKGEDGGGWERRRGRVGTWGWGRSAPRPAQRRGLVTERS